MKQFSSNELRKAWIKFYEERGHVNCGAVSLVSDGSTGVLFNIAGMQPLMPYLLGQKHPLGTRLCNVQGCVRTNDIDSVGDKSHVTFFEMMGSWSLGDYFKEDRCKWSYELLTQVFGFDADHLAATVFAGDENAPRDEEGAQCRSASGFKEENIHYLPAEDNWWGLEFGPCGPDSEMFYVADVPDCGPDCGPGCHCGKYTELGNDVFMQYEKHKDGHLTPLAKKNVDTGWGLERNLAFLNGTKDVYKTDLFAGAVAYIEKKSGKKYDADDEFSKSMRILADHTRTSVMLIGDEAKLTPSNAGAGYVLRRLIRRAVRHGRKLGLVKSDILNIAAVFIDEVYSESYPLLKKNRSFILDELEKEISRFESTLENGMKEFRKLLDKAKEDKITTIDGKTAFYLYDTFGFPLELTTEMAGEEGINVDAKGFDEAMEEQKTKAREGKSFAQKNVSSIFDGLGDSVVSEFNGYDTLSFEENIVAAADEEKLTDSLKAGEKGSLVFAKTPFYATMGGQLHDTGVIETAEGSFKVTEVTKIPGNRIAHFGYVESGVIKKGAKAVLKVDAERRAKTCRNHTATHLLQKALQIVLGDQVAQQGSYQDSERTRFDFSCSRAVTKEELLKAEEIVNRAIEDNIKVTTAIMDVEEAKKTGAMALFGEKYGKEVRVVSVGDFSKELCGGTHVSYTGEIGCFKILSESGIAAGVRRIEGVTGSNVLAYFNNVENMLNSAAAIAKTTPDRLSDKIEQLFAQIKALSQENESLKSKAANDSLGDIEKNMFELSGVKAVVAEVKGIDANGLRTLCDSLKEKFKDLFVLVVSETDGKVNLVSMASDGAVAKGAHSGNLIKAVAPLVQGGGGGRPNMAQAGGKDPSGIEKAIEKAKEIMKSQIA